jgi:hypothetical protein
MFEHHRQPLVPTEVFLRRLLRHGGIALALIASSLLVGVLGYRFIGGLGWVDAIENAAMILGGMGPVSPLTTDVAKLFAALYALFSGIVFLVGVAVLLAPVLHRFMHRFHLGEDDKAGAPKR